MKKTIMLGLSLIVTACGGGGGGASNCDEELTVAYIQNKFTSEFSDLLSQVPRSSILMAIKERLMTLMLSLYREQHTMRMTPSLFPIPSMARQHQPVILILLSSSIAIKMPQPECQLELWALMHSW